MKVLENSVVDLDVLPGKSQGQMQQQVQGQVDAAGNQIAANLPPEQQKQAQGMGGAAMNAASGVAGALGGGVKGVGDTLGNTAGALGGGLGNTVTGIAGGLGGAGKDLAGGVQNTMGMGGGEVEEKAEEAKESAED